MNFLRLSPILIIALFTFLKLCLQSVNALINENKLLENDLLKRYDKRHRPVKKESNTMSIQVFLMINHIERVDEKEQTMLLHGVLWAMWTDEYLTWNPADYNGTQYVSIESWKLWQPTFALYNSARSNGWFVYMNGMPATVGSQGRVIGTGTFSFYVTCLFDFSDYPYDVQQCPIVLADWMYDLSKVNLSESVGNPTLNLKPVLRLSYDLLNGTPKNHVAGWEMLDTWQKHCYWGPKGCTDETPFMVALDNYWSLLEFGIKIRRHAPYYGLTMVLPTVVTAAITLLIFWIEDLSLAVAICVFNILLQSFYGSALIQQLPPGNGNVPKIAKIYSWNLTLTIAAYVIHALIQYSINVLPDETKLPFQIQNISSKLKSLRFFKIKGFLLDPNVMSFSPLDMKLENDVFLNEEQHHSAAALRYIDTEALTQENQLIIDMEPVFEEESRVKHQKQSKHSDTQSSSSSQSLPMVELDLSENRPASLSPGDIHFQNLNDEVEEREKNGDKNYLITATDEQKGSLAASAGKKWIIKLKKAVTTPTKSHHIGIGATSLDQPVVTASGSGINKAFVDEDENETNKKRQESQNIMDNDRIVNEAFGEFPKRKSAQSARDDVRTCLESADINESNAKPLHNDLFVLRRLIFAVFFIFFVALIPLLLL